MNQLFAVVVAFFTQSGVGMSALPAEDLETCKFMASTASDFIGKKVPGPDGKETTVIDAQGQCITFTQAQHAEK